MMVRTRIQRAVPLVAVAAAALTLTLHAQSSVQRVVDAAYAKYRTLQEGKNADYIPALANRRYCGLLEKSGAALAVCVCSGVCFRRLASPCKIGRG